MASEIVEILKAAVGLKASDIHIVVGRPPMVRLSGAIQPLKDFPAINKDQSYKLVYSLLADYQKKQFEKKLELDCSVNLPGVARFRANVFWGHRGIESVLRVINTVIPSPVDIGLTPEIEKLTKLNKGLVLVTGPTGSGKTTTLACLIDIINQSKADNILTIEDPIEFVYESKKSIIRQREVGTTTLSFANALKSSLREDPDVILIGEMRDLETISLALTAGETGHLVLGTLHTTDAPQTIDRVIDVFPPHQQQQIRVQLSNTLRAVVCQTLVPRLDGAGRVAAREVMMITPAIANLIREGKTHMIYSAIETGSKFGMQSMDQNLSVLVKKGVISREDAISKAKDPKNIK